MTNVLLAVLFSGALGCASDPAPSAAAPAKAAEPAPVVAKAPEAPKPAVQDRPSDQRLYPLKDLERVEVRVGAKKIRAWVMDTGTKRSEGMMWLSDREVRDDEGMLFVFRDAAVRSFWMQNTLIPLDIVYLDQGGKVLNIQKGKPLDETGLPSEGDAQYVLELKAGRAARFGIKPGVRITLPKHLSAKN